MGPSPSSSDELAQLEDLRRLKARYFRLLDTKDWDGLVEVFTAPVDIDVADVTATLGLAVITVTSVCTAALAIVIVVRVYKYVRSAL